jgi:arsenate reductase (thioredoxin)
MSAYLFNAMVDPSSATAISAGSKPAEHVHPEVKDAMRELGHDLSGAVPQRLSRELLEASGTTVCVLMGCGDACPLVPGRDIEVVEWKVPDPHGAGLEAVREIRDGLRERVEQLVEERGLKRRTA